MSQGVDRFTLLATALVAIVFGMAPTVGDIGSCGQPAADLDAPRFFRTKRALDCTQCRECHLETEACRRSCSEPPATAFPEGCWPLVHDGEVCLAALHAGSCSDYARWMADEGATAPSECRFCPHD